MHVISPMPQVFNFLHQCDMRALSFELTIFSFHDSVFTVKAVSSMVELRGKRIPEHHLDHWKAFKPSFPFFDEMKILLLTVNQVDWSPCSFCLWSCTWTDVNRLRTEQAGELQSTSLSIFMQDSTARKTDNYIQRVDSGEKPRSERYVCTN